MRTDSRIDRLSQELRPVRPRSLLRDALVLAALRLVEAAVFLGMGFMRPDMPGVMDQPSFWWKLVSMGLIAVLGTGIALISIDLTRSPHRRLRWILSLSPSSLQRDGLLTQVREALRICWLASIGVMVSDAPGR